MSKVCYLPDDRISRIRRDVGARLPDNTALRRARQYGITGICTAGIRHLKTSLFVNIPNKQKKHAENFDENSESGMAKRRNFGRWMRNITYRNFHAGYKHFETQI
jgi:hypothetical protein